VAELSSAPVPAAGDDDHVRGSGPAAVLYVDLACPYCAATWAAVRELPLELCVRHFPVESLRPRAPALHAATEAAARLGGEAAFWAMWDSLLEDQGHQDDPHLWSRAERIGLELKRFDAERRSEAVAGRVRRDFRSGIRAGVAGTPAALVGGRLLGAEPVAALRELAVAGEGPRAGRADL
jgi:protein-disulfide isomerase